MKPNPDRKFILIFRCAIILGMWLVGFGTCVSALAQNRLMEAVLGVQQKYAAVETISAAFQQFYRGPGIEQSESGTLVMKKPGLMRWEYTEPEKKLFVADGRDMWLYVPEDRQVTVQAFTAADMRNTPLRFLLGQGEIMKSFVPSWEKELDSRFEGTLLVRLLPRQPEQDYQFIVIECTARDYTLRRIVLREATGNTSEFIFSRITMNVKTEKKLFEFRPPKGVEIIRLDEK